MTDNGANVNIQWEDVPCPCPWCRAGDGSGMHRIRRMWADDKPPSAEAKALMDEIVRDAIRAVKRQSTEPTGGAAMKPVGDTILTAAQAAIEWHDNVEATCDHEEWVRHPAEPDIGIVSDYEECSLCGKLR